MKNKAQNKIDSKLVSQSFSKAAVNYEKHAVLQKEVAYRLIEKLDYIKTDPKVIIDAGCGTGYCTRLLSKKFPKAKITGFDLAPGMVAYAQSKMPWYRKPFAHDQYQVADIRELPLEDNSVDFIFSNLSIQWISDIDLCFQEWQRILKPGGLLLFSTFGPDTLFQLKRSWAAVDNDIHVNHFTDMHDLGDSLIQQHFAQPVMDAEVITTTYDNVKQLLKELKAIGANNLSSDRAASLTGKNKLQQMFLAYEQFKTADGWIPASWEVVYGHAWGGDYQGPKMQDKETFVLSKDLNGSSLAGKSSQIKYTEAT
ncbi:MAG: malonyl-[acyl-carrier protein] O-methyltransferase BioC [Gammaproteobacteria bacterium CG22_combo_CG10-13_8_21_14_all_40_8]|nr:MAG: malonyl-[acyl-carrier protein] O-methyltransferase BioC [Gammaproteobacteria bacterium CG22_combo_CG10-13_8_21_14_all_40_8]